MPRTERTAQILSCDWGTSSFRLRLLSGQGTPKILADRSNSRGITTFTASDTSEFESYLRMEAQRLFRSAGIRPRPLPIYLSGMITSTLGWKNLPYAELPFKLDGARAVTERDQLVSEYGSHEMTFISGVKSADDVLRGEESELIAVFADARFRSSAEASIAIL